MSTTTIERRKVGREWQTTPIGPTPVAPVPARPPVDPPTEPSPLEPSWYPGRACYDHGNISEIEPPSLSRDALAVLVEARGEARLRQDLIGALSYGDGLVREAVGALLTAHDRTPLVDRITRLLADRRTYGSRLQAVGGDAPVELAVPVALIRWVAHPEPVFAIDRALADARVTLGDVGRELAEIQATAAVDASYWQASIPPGNAGADAWLAVCDLVRQTYGQAAHTA